MNKLGKVTSFTIDGQLYNVHDSRDFICTENGSRKFWKARLAECAVKTTAVARGGAAWIVVLHWGRIGTVGSKTEKFFNTKEAATKYFSESVTGKLAKGYVKDPDASIESNVNDVMIALAPVEYVSTSWDLE